jgi:ribonuclease HI
VTSKVGADAIPELVAVQEAIERARDKQATIWKSLQDQSDWEVYTDGSAPIKNPGGAIGFSTVFLVNGDSAWEVYGGTPGRTSEPATSNNRAEIAGALTILEVLYILKSEGKTPPRSIEIVCDSQYVVNCAQGKWKKKKNKDLWNRFDRLLCVARQNKVKLVFRWTRAHVGTKWNERADVLAKDGAFLAIGKNPDATSPKAEPEAKPQRPDCDYLLQLYSEMTGKDSAKGIYRLSTPQRERETVLELKNVITLDEAEYKLLSEGLEDLLGTLAEADRKAEEFRVLVDSARDLMLKQIQGIYGVKSERLQPLHRKVTKVARQFAGVDWQKSKKAELKDALKTW